MSKNVLFGVLNDTSNNFSSLMNKIFDALDVRSLCAR